MFRLITLATLATLLVTLSLALSACGNDDGSADTTESPTATAAVVSDGDETQSPETT